ncbi:M23 family metallopeptidase [Chloroflexi bacterium TSY]|nr:M23 family metallopeptidase [Chloroflexi bacterium TSY]
MRKRFVTLLITGAAILIGYWTVTTNVNDGGSFPNLSRIIRLRSWFKDPARYPDWSLSVGSRCGDALMLIPTTGYLGFGWGDSFRPGHRHSGLDIFSPDGENNITPIVAAYDGYLTRESGWRSTVIIRHPDFPLSVMNPDLTDQQIWTYYTHMASSDGTESYVDSAFPPGTHGVFVKAGTLLGKQGNWSGNPNRSTGLHLHFSVVKSKPDGGYLDEREIRNTLEATQFLGLVENKSGIWRCED